MLTFILSIVSMAPGTTESGSGLYIQTLWLLQRHGTAAATHIEHDTRLKSSIAAALAKDNVITRDELGVYMSHATFQSLARDDDLLDGDDILQAVTAAVPPSRAKLHAAVRNHAEYLTTSFDMIDASRYEAIRQLANWIVVNYREGERLDIVLVCTGNSRRSILGSSLGNLAAAYYGLTDIRFYSGGTDPTAFNPRTIQSLQSIGFQIEAIDQEAPRGKDQQPNPIYRLGWGADLDDLEFSKHYADAKNPKKGFAAVMVCNEADSDCPRVTGAALRLSMPYEDPKTYDGSSFEQLKYAERRDDIGRTLFSVMCQVKRELGSGRGR